MAYSLHPSSQCYSLVAQTEHKAAAAPSLVRPCLMQHTTARLVQPQPTVLQQPQVLASQQSRVSCCAGSNSSENATSSSNSGSSSSSSQELSDFAYVIRLLAISFAGGAAIKYGSLLSTIPFDHSATLAVTLVLGPVVAYGLNLAKQSL